MKPSKPTESQGMRLIRQLFLRGKRIFDMQDAKSAAEMEKIPISQLAKIVANLAKQGYILRLRRGLYVSIGLLPEQTKTHPFVISAFLIQPSAISHWSALQYHGLTEQVPQSVTASTYERILTPSMREKYQKKMQKKHAREIDGVRYEYISVQEKQYSIGIEQIWIDENFQVSITDKERTLLDVFIFSKMFGGMGEALGILENALGEIDIKKLVGYALKYDKKSVIKRLGWALEYFGVSADYFIPLLNVPMSYYCRLDPSKPAVGPCDKRWMIQNNLLK